MERITLGRMQNPIRGFIHGLAAVASLIGLIALAVRSWGATAAFIGALVFGVALVLMFTASSLYHSVPWSPPWKARMQRIDHSMIFLVVAGTFTPIAIASLAGRQLVIALASVWGLAAMGILLKVVLRKPATWLSVTIQLLMGWSALIWLPAIYRTLGGTALALILLGGVAYMVGVVLFLAKRPRLHQPSFSYHELFHVLVVTASTIHFVVVIRYAIPALV